MCNFLTSNNEKGYKFLKHEPKIYQKLSSIVNTSVEACGLGHNERLHLLVVFAVDSWQNRLASNLRTKAQNARAD